MAAVLGKSESVGRLLCVLPWNKDNCHQCLPNDCAMPYELEHDMEGNPIEW